MSKSLFAAQEPSGSPYSGTLQINVTSSVGFFPVSGATVSISDSDTPDQVIEQLTTDESGQTRPVELPAPNLAWSLEPSQPRPYTDYNIEVTAPGYEPVRIVGSELLPDEISLQNVSMKPLEVSGTDAEEDINIPDHTLYGEYPPKIPEAEIKTDPETGEIILSRVVIPEYVIVHDGLPNDSSAPNYYVRYKDYIKNVASSEIYATWPESSIYANILAIQSFTLNRVYTEWYRSKGYPFTITSSTAYDQKFIYGRNIFSDIDRLVDSVFANYLSRPGVQQPIFTSYCDGERVTCQGLSQWGSKYLGDQGYSAIEIIRYYYGNDMFINSAVAISGVPSSWPGYNLNVGASGAKVQQLQEQLNRIAQNFPAIPAVTADGIYGEQTAQAVAAFQRIFDLPPNGITDYSTWYEISSIYTAVTRIAEP
ncbi:MAG TPA: peptidoglycan-binding protein [Candidatus Eisenbergiella merdigallinarum]|uniref:Peptidoglycan-binding protein n=1 Tax=Candidatus Eisenbergiella merdigallinarum TaxID=2838552 RepID=A0A9D2SCN8_9FIRM|nr:peptidoglycan-binding protein [Candidatus Eisenbergiella merdigallinarum]